MTPVINKMICFTQKQAERRIVRLSACPSLIHGCISVGCPNKAKECYSGVLYPLRLIMCLCLYNVLRRPKWDTKTEIFLVIKIRVQVEGFKLVVADAFQLSQNADCQFRKLSLTVFEIRPHFDDSTMPLATERRVYIIIFIYERGFAILSSI